jgi:hypothetical protein
MTAQGTFVTAVVPDIRMFTEIVFDHTMCLAVASSTQQPRAELTQPVLGFGGQPPLMSRRTLLFHCVLTLGVSVLWIYLRVVTVAVQRTREMRVGPDPAHLLIDVLAKVGYIKDTTPIVQARVSQIFS